MKLSQLAAKPQLIKITLDDESIVTQYGEPIEFYTWDRQPLEVFMRLANQSQTDGSSIIDIIKTLILNAWESNWRGTRLGRSGYQNDNHSRQPRHKISLSSQSGT